MKLTLKQRFFLATVGVIILTIISLVTNSGTRVEAAELGYGKDTMCQMPQGATEPGQAVCQTIPVPQGWQEGSIPTPTAEGLTNLNVSSSGTGFVEHVVSEGGYVSSEDANASLNERLFFVHPSNLAALPLLANHQLDFFGHNGSIKNIHAIGVALPVPADEDPASKVQNITPGLTFPVFISPNEDGTYTQEFAVPSPTYTQSTDGTLNEIGYAFGVYYTVDLELNGMDATVQIVRAYHAKSGYFADLANLQPEPCSGDVCIGGGSFSLQIREISAEPISPEVPVVPEQPETPVVPETPVTPSEPEPVTAPTPDYPRVNTGGTSTSPAAFIFMIASMTFGTAMLVLFFRRKNEQA